MLKYSVALDQERTHESLCLQHEQIGNDEQTHLKIYLNHFRKMGDDINYMFVESYLKNTNLFE